MQNSSSESDRVQYRSDRMQRRISVSDHLLFVLINRTTSSGQLRKEHTPELIPCELNIQRMSGSIICDKETVSGKDTGTGILLKFPKVTLPIIIIIEQTGMLQIV